VAELESDVRLGRNEVCRPVIFLLLVWGRIDAAAAIDKWLLSRSFASVDFDSFIRESRRPDLPTDRPVSFVEECLLLSSPLDDTEPDRFNCRSLTTDSLEPVMPIECLCLRLSIEVLRRCLSIDLGLSIVRFADLSTD
jgi:hypothetical protein